MRIQQESSVFDLFLSNIFLQLGDTAAAITETNVELHPPVVSYDGLVPVSQSLVMSTGDMPFSKSHSPYFI